MFSFLRRPRKAEPASLPQGLFRLPEPLAQRFAVLQEVSNQSPGECYLVVDAEQQPFRVRILRCRTERQPALFARLRQSTNLQHPSVLRWTEVGEGDDFVWALEPAARPDDSFDTLLQTAPHDPGEVDGWLRQLLSLWQFASRIGVVHGHLNPDCIFLEEGRVVVADWGLSSVVNDFCIAGTGDFRFPYVIAPEQLSDSVALSPESDLFVVGCLGYHLVSGVHPFEASDGMQRLVRILSEEPSTLDSSLPLALRQSIEGLLNKRSDRRTFQSRPDGGAASEVIQSLQTEGDYREGDGFTLDPKRAIVQLASFQFVESEDFWLPLVAAANAWNARELVVRRNSRKLTFLYSGCRISGQEMENLFAYALADRRTGMAHFALGVAGALGIRDVQVLLESDGHSTRLKQVGTPVLKSGSQQELRLTLERSQAWSEPSEPLLKRLAESPVGLSFDGKPMTRCFEGPELEQGGLVLRLRLRGRGLRQSSCKALVNGLLFELKTTGLPSGATALLRGNLQHDLTYRNLIHNEELAQAASALPGCLQELAMQQVQQHPLRLEWLELYNLALPHLSHDEKDRLFTGLLQLEPELFAVQHPLYRCAMASQGNVEQLLGEKPLYAELPSTFRAAREWVETCYPWRDNSGRRLLLYGWLYDHFPLEPMQGSELLRELTAYPVYEQEYLDPLVLPRVIQFYRANPGLKPGDAPWEQHYPPAMKQVRSWFESFA